MCGAETPETSLGTPMGPASFLQTGMVTEDLRLAFQLKEVELQTKAKEVGADASLVASNNSEQCFSATLKR